MKGKKLRAVLIMLCIALAVTVMPLMVACAPEAPTPTPTPTPAPTPTPTPAPEGQVFKIQWSSAYPESAGMWARSVRFLGEEWARLVEAETTHKIENDFSVMGVVCAPGEELETIEGGACPAGIVCTVFEPAKCQLQNLTYWLPFDSPDPWQVEMAIDRVIVDYPIYLDIYEKYNMKVIGRTPNDSFQMITTFPVKTLEDLKGHKLSHGGAMVPWINALGGVGVASPLAEGYISMDTGVYEGWLHTVDAYYGLKFYEVAPYYTEIKWGASDPQIYAVNLDYWNKLPEEVQQLAFQAGNFMMWRSAYLQTVEKAAKLNYMVEQGLNVYEPPREERVRWAQLLDDALIADGMAKKADAEGLPGTELLKSYIKNLKAVGYEFLVEPTVK